MNGENGNSFETFVVFIGCRKKHNFQDKWHALIITYLLIDGTLIKNSQCHFQLGMRLLVLVAALTAIAAAALPENEDENGVAEETEVFSVIGTC